MRVLFSYSLYDLYASRFVAMARGAAFWRCKKDIGELAARDVGGNKG